jgi:ParB-like chromosome segregation protein Spo0J
VSLTVEYWQIERLAPNPRNARTHTDEQIDQLVASIKEFGWTNPILVDPGDNDVIALIRLTKATSALDRGWCP